MTTRRTVKLTESEARLLGEAALAAQLSTPDYIREAALRYTLQMLERISGVAGQGRGREQEVPSE